MPFVLRSGKALGTPRKEIIVTFRDVAHLPTGLGPATTEPDSLRLDLKTGEVSLSLTMNAEGDPFDLEQKTLTITLSPADLLPYGEILAQIFDGSQLLTVRGDAAVECWRIVEPVLTAWQAGRSRWRSTPPARPGRPAGSDPHLDTAAIAPLRSAWRPTR